VSALDDSQMTAARAEAGPHLIEAGPGTGKTRTLIARIEWLLERVRIPVHLTAGSDSI
ncbi:MAG: AAA family ATPase, partial [Boseongicola sp. SB0673_bin_14]|nr:AAA family ATPase [Boseongicola sp. SB0673_bin_14]